MKVLEKTESFIEMKNKLWQRGVINIFVLIGLAIVVLALPLTTILVQRRQEIRIKAGPYPTIPPIVPTPTSPPIIPTSTPSPILTPIPKGEQYPPGCCFNSELGNYRSCPSGQACDIPNGACGPGGKSCNPAGSGYHKACVGEQCVNVPGAGPDECLSHSGCKFVPTSPPSPTPKGEQYPAGCCFNSELGNYRSCPGGQACNIPNGACGPGGKSCNPSSGGGFHKDWVDGQCVYVPGAGDDKCGLPTPTSKPLTPTSAPSAPTSTPKPTFLPIGASCSTNEQCGGYKYCDSDSRICSGNKCKKYICDIGSCGKPRYEDTELHTCRVGLHAPPDYKFCCPSTEADCNSFCKISLTPTPRLTLVPTLRATPTPYGRLTPSPIPLGGACSNDEQCGGGQKGCGSNQCRENRCKRYTCDVGLCGRPEFGYTETHACQKGLHSPPDNQFCCPANETDCNSYCRTLTVTPTPVPRGWTGKYCHPTLKAICTLSLPPKCSPCTSCEGFIGFARCLDIIPTPVPGGNFPSPVLTSAPIPTPTVTPTPVPRGWTGKYCHPTLKAICTLSLPPKCSPCTSCEGFIGFARCLDIIPTPVPGGHFPPPELTSIPTPTQAPIPTVAPAPRGWTGKYCHSKYRSPGICTLSLPPKCSICANCVDNSFWKGFATCLDVIPTPVPFE